MRTTTLVLMTSLFTLTGCNDGGGGGDSTTPSRTDLMNNNINLTQDMENLPSRFYSRSEPVDEAVVGESIMILDKNGEGVLVRWEDDQLVEGEITSSGFEGQGYGDLSGSVSIDIEMKEFSLETNWPDGEQGEMVMSTPAQTTYDSRKDLLLSGTFYGMSGDPTINPTSELSFDYATDDGTCYYKGEFLPATDSEIDGLWEVVIQDPADFDNSACQETPGDLGGGSIEGYALVKDRSGEHVELKTFLYGPSGWMKTVAYHHDMFDF